MTTEQRVSAAGWWPTKTTPRREDYLGPAVCSQCHKAEASLQGSTPMAKACVRAGQSRILEAHQRLSLRLDRYRYDITRSGAQSHFSVSDGNRAVSAVLEWAFGAGEVGETYVFERGGSSYESQLSYFPVLGKLDLTPGHAGPMPSSPEDAIGRALRPEETRLCFGCHNTASSTAGQLDRDHLIPGVTCEACHGPGADHVSAIRNGRSGRGRTQIMNPGNLGPIDSVDFCGSCHRTWADAAEAGMTGIETVRFQPYRLEGSRCWGSGDARITCLACHDPHRPVVRDTGSYDKNCLACHATSTGAKPTPDHPGAACPKSSGNCITCHMPQFEPPGTHTKFTDHRIRIAKPESPYPG